MRASCVRLAGLVVIALLQFAGVASAQGPLAMVMSFNPSTTKIDEQTTMTVTVINPNRVQTTDVSFSNTYPAGIVPDMVGAYTFCAGSAVFTERGWSIGNVTLGPGASCSVPVIVHATTPGPKVDTTSQVTSSGEPPGGPASATLRVLGNTSTAVQSSKDPSVPAERVMFTATVSAVAPADGTPTGTVTFLDGGSAIGTGSLTGGTATLSTTALATGSHTITAQYGGDADFNVSNGSLTGNPQLVAGAPSVSIAAPVGSAWFALGQVVPASFTCGEGVGGPGIASCTGPVANGAAIDTAHAGDFTFTVTATSQDGFTATGRAAYRVAKAPTTLGAAPLKLQRGRTPQPVTARLTRADTGAAVAGAPVVFTAAGAQLCTAQTDANGDATCAFATPPDLEAAVRSGYTVAFAGDGDHLPASVTAILTLPVTNAGQVLLCAGRKVTLFDVRRAKRTQLVKGLALTSLAGQRVTITADHGGGKKVAKVAADGSFSARFPIPKSDQTSYQARYGSSKSSSLKITRKLYVDSKKRTANGVRIVAHHSKGKRVAGQVATIRRTTGCGTQTVAGTARFDKHGKITVTLAFPTPPDTIAVYRLTTRTNKTFTLPIIVRSR
jgi:hypothetical protein